MNFEKLKDFVECELEWMSLAEDKDEVERSLNRAFGATQFYLTCNPDQYEEINKWWVIQRDIFYELRRKAPAKKEWKKRVDKQ